MPDRPNGDITGVGVNHQLPMAPDGPQAGVGRQRSTQIVKCLFLLRSPDKLSILTGEEISMRRHALCGSFATPKICLNSSRFTGVAQWFRANTFSVRGLIPSLQTTCPKYSTSFRNRKHFFAFSFRLLAAKLKTCSNFSSKPFDVVSQATRGLPATLRSEALLLGPSNGAGLATGSEPVQEKPKATHCTGSFP